ncbi:MAG: lamin tail domain-containing protein [Candidatus Pacearchaeota archaeon]
MVIKRGGGILIITLILIVSLPIINAIIVINEVEPNPPGSDIGNEWIEIYTDEEINLSGWYILTSDNTKHFFPNISVSGFYVLDGLAGLGGMGNNQNENLSLKNPNNTIIDNTGIFNESGGGSSLTWSRFPDITGNFSSKNSTKGLPNEETKISNKSSNPSCLIKNDNVTLNVKVTGFCIEEVIFSLFKDGGWQNFTGINLGNNNYSIEVDTSLFLQSGEIKWTVFAKNCFNITKKNGNETFYLNNHTILFVNPSSPDGLNNFYITEPEFTLKNNDGINIFYQWDNDEIKKYTSPFKLEDTPNNWQLTGGIIELNYWSDFSCKNESKKSFLFVGDFQDPVIMNISPKNNSVISNPTPKISAEIRELFNDNSGINISSIVFMLNGIIEIPLILQNGLDVILSFTSQNELEFGRHNVSIFVKDNAGRISQLNWSFNVSFQEPLNFTFLNLIGENFSDKNLIPLNISLNQISSEILYKNLNDKNPRFKRLCRNCDSYGNKRVKKIRLNEGENNITFKVLNNNETIEKNVSIFVDSKIPKIIRVFPQKNMVTNGSLFFIRYSEENLKEIILTFNPEISLNTCPSGRDVQCIFNPNLSSFDGGTINFSFMLKDYVNNVTTKNISVKVDTTPPELDITEPVSNSNYSTKVPFNVTISEHSTLGYIDLNSSIPVFKELCRNCNKYGAEKIKIVRLARGNHTIIVMAVDKAGNSNKKIFNLEIL